LKNFEYVLIFCGVRRWMRRSFVERETAQTIW